MDKILADSAALGVPSSFPDEESYDKLASGTVTRLQSLSPAQHASTDTLESLDAATQTLPYLFILHTAVKNAISQGKGPAGQPPKDVLPEGDLWPFITTILINFDVVQVRYAGQWLTDLVQIVVAGAEQTSNYIPAIQLLNTVILRLDHTSSTFTSTHHAYVRLCLLSQAYGEALSIIEQPVYHIPGGQDKQTEGKVAKFRCSQQDSSASWLTLSSGLTAKITARTVMEYNLMCALCYMALGQYPKAILFLEVVMIAPTANGASSVIAVDAYKKWILLNLLISGSVPEYPRPVFQATLRNVRTLAKPYESVAEAFKQRDSSRLVAEMQEAQQVWHDDFHTGLVMEVFSAHRKYVVLNLGKTFASIPVSQVEAYLPQDPDNTPAVTYLQNLIASGDLRATITPLANGSDHTLRFLSDAANKKSEIETEADLNNRAQHLQGLLKHIGELEHRMQISKEYIEMLKKLKKNRDDDSRKITPPGQIKGPNADVDEDMMTDEF